MGAPTEAAFQEVEKYLVGVTRADIDIPLSSIFFFETFEFAKARKITFYKDVKIERVRKVESYTGRSFEVFYLLLNWICLVNGTGKKVPNYR